MIKEFYYYDRPNKVIAKSEFEKFGNLYGIDLWQNLSSDDYDLYYESSLFETFSECRHGAIETIKNEIEELEEERFNLVKQDFV